MTALNCKALVVGGGPAGLAAAALLAHSGVETVCVAPSPKHDPRTTALMSPSIRLLEFLGLWTDDLRQFCAPLKQLHLIDDTGNLVQAPALRFTAAEAGLEAFGWNIPLANLLPSLRARATALGVQFIEGEVTSISTSASYITAITSLNQKIVAECAIAADGRNSILRQSAGIKASQWAFDQSALVTRFSHSASHEYVSTEWHKLGGPFTTVPLPGKNSALVWMDKPEKIDALMQRDGKTLAREIQLMNHGQLGLINNVATPHSFAMCGVKAESFAANRTYLIGEAAHVFPPVGAQGLNMSLRDAGHVLDVINNYSDSGSEVAMQVYNNLRSRDVLPRQTAISAMNHSLLSDLLPPHLARAAGLAAVAAIPVLRNFAIREGLSPSGGLPMAMRG